MPSVQKITSWMGLDRSPRLRKLVIGVIGGTIVLVGLVLIVLPGPAIIVIPIGLIVLASEFAWARWILHRGKMVVGKARSGKWRSIFASDKEQ